jgi:hypothetical protein
MRLIVILGVVIFLLSVFLIKYTLSLSQDFYTERTCSNVFSTPCSDDTLDDIIITPNRQICNGTRYSAAGEVDEVIVNQTVFLSNTGINITCKAANVARGSGNTSIYIWYNDTQNWYSIRNWTFEGNLPYLNFSVIFTVNSTPGMHVIRCVQYYDYGANKTIPTNCAPGGINIETGDAYDNDDVNFTVTDYPKYTFWNLTNYTTGATIQDGSHLTRNDTINASAQWDKQLYNANISHNGTGTFQNYTICSPCSGTWTNYTLNLSNTNEFNRTGMINISYIWVNDTYGLENFTSSKHFYLWGNSKVGQIYINSSSIYNNTGAGIFCLVLDKDLNQPISSYNVSFYMNNGG